jgi:hypothetical protein
VLISLSIRVLAALAAHTEFASCIVFNTNMEDIGIDNICSGSSSKTNNDNNYSNNNTYINVIKFKDNKFIFESLCLLFNYKDLEICQATISLIMRILKSLPMSTKPLLPPKKNENEKITKDLENLLDILGPKPVDGSNGVKGVNTVSEAKPYLSEFSGKCLLRGMYTKLLFNMINFVYVYIYTYVYIYMYL